MTDTPCEQFVVPADGLYPAYCDRCGYSRVAHESWGDWTDEATAAPTPPETDPE